MHVESAGIPSMTVESNYQVGFIDGQGAAIMVVITYAESINFTLGVSNGPKD